MPMFIDKIDNLQHRETDFRENLLYWLVVAYQGQTYTERQVMHHLRQMASPVARYDASVEVRDIMLDAHEKGESMLARLYGYV
ncbi:hypothetical protein MMC29_006080, partial [Sticta canariensis]|nr:hypothetical protein [Sticta canariensis]